MLGKTAAGILLGAAALVGGHASAGAVACKPGPLMLSGHPAFAYCGPATATIKSAGKTVTRIANGRCYRTAQYFQIDIGIDQKPPTDRAEAAKLKRPDYLRLSLGNNPATLEFAKQTKSRLAYPNAPRDGTYTKIRELTVVVGHTEFALSTRRSTVTLRKHRTAGTFSALLTGQDRRTGKPTIVKAFTGSFTCG